MKEMKGIESECMYIQIKKNQYNSTMQKDISNTENGEGKEKRYIKITELTGQGKPSGIQRNISIVKVVFKTIRSKQGIKRI